jgi:hypothetical protein
MDKLLRDIYYNDETGYLNVNDLFHKALEDNSKITRKFVSDWLHKQEVYQQVRKKKKAHYMPIISHGENEWQSDLMFLEKDFSLKINRGYHIILVFIHVASRRIVAYPLKNKMASTTSEKLDEFLRENKIDKLTIDFGVEFKANFARKLKDRGIEVYINKSFDNKNKLSLVERANRTIRGLILKRSEVHSGNWIDGFDGLMKNYNSRKKKIMDKPVKESEKIQEIKQKGDALTDYYAFDTGDVVRLLKVKDGFAKEGKNYTKELYKIVGKDGLSFIVQKDGETPLARKYMSYELQLVKDVEKPPTAFQIQENAPIMAQEKKDNRRKKRQVKDFGGAKGHEVETITDQGEVVLKKRLQPTASKRVSKSVQKFGS